MVHPKPVHLDVTTLNTFLNCLKKTFLQCIRMDSANNYIEEQQKNIFF